MLPAIAPGDWLLVDPTTAPLAASRDRSWSSASRTPATLAIKRVAAGPGDRVPFADGYLILAEDEAWLLADADEETTRAAGLRRADRLAPVRAVPLDLLVGRAWFRYGPLRRFGPIRRG